MAAYDTGGTEIGEKYTLRLVGSKSLLVTSTKITLATEKNEDSHQRITRDVSRVGRSLRQGTPVKAIDVHENSYVSITAFAWHAIPFLLSRWTKKRYSRYHTFCDSMDLDRGIVDESRPWPKLT